MRLIIAVLAYVSGVKHYLHHANFNRFVEKKLPLYRPSRLYLGHPPTPFPLRLHYLGYVYLNFMLTVLVKN